MLEEEMNNERSWIEINLSHFEYNLQEIKKFLSPQQDFLQIIKADAYGHGAFQIATQALLNGAKLLGVANADEALFIRYNSISAPILILSPSLESEIENIVLHNLIPTVNDLDFAKKLNSFAHLNKKKIKIHLNIDSGMNRSGIRADQALSFCQELSHLPNLIIDGIFTHFAESESNLDFTNNQYQIFCNVLDRILEEIPNLNPTYLHSSNSSAVVNYNFPRMNLARIGILSFGIYPHASLQKKITLKPVMKFITKISQIKEAKEGEYISYNLTYQAKNSLKYAILPIGYADGYNFFLSNKGKVLCQDKLIPILGKVTMDMTIVDISSLDKPQVGQEVILYGEDSLRIEDLTQLYAGSSYELATQTGKRAKRYYYYDQKIIAIEARLRRDFYSPDFSAKKLSLIIKNALKTRINSSEISQVLFSEIISDFIKESDNNISYRTNFKHHIKFSLSPQYPEFYLVDTELSYSKVLNEKDFIIACASDAQTLDSYFRNPQVEYRWLLTAELSLNSQFFVLKEVTVNDIPAITTITTSPKVLEFHNTNENYSQLIGTKCNFSIKTRTLYPIDSHQLSVFISEPTKGVKISFEFPPSLQKVEAVTLFSGESKYPTILEAENTISVETGKDIWILPKSGVIFSY